MTKSSRQLKGGAPPPPARAERSGSAPPRQPAPEVRRASAWQRQSTHRAPGRGGVLYLLVPAVVVIAVGAVLLSLMAGKGGNAAAGASQPASDAASSQLADVIWPAFVSRGPQSVKEAYQFAALRPDVLQYMPCYCGCGQHSGHRSNRDCFIANLNQGGKTIAFDPHGST